jgi:mRNA interferase YafQ
MSTKRISASRSVTREVRNTSTFKKDLKRGRSHIKCDVEELRAVMRKIEYREVLVPKYLDHPLEGRYPKPDGHTDCRECHVGNDWLLVYRFPDDDSVDFIRTGTHSELF